MSDRIERAIDRAYAWALHLPDRPPRSVRPRPRRFAIGDPQAALETFLSILDRNELLGDDGTLAPDVMLVSLGDHFDWGKPGDVAKATDDGLAILAWLAHHEPDQVVIIAGNHDLARVGELVSFDDETYVRMRDEARLAYRGGAVDEAAERAFLSRWPALPTAEAAGRDFSCFRAHQRALVAHLLERGRMQLAHAEGDALLFLHAGVTTPDLRALGVPDSAGAHEIAAALDRALADAVAAWNRSDPLVIPRVHRPGNARDGEGGGVLYHRAARARFDHRRFDPKTLPRNVTQVIGHVRDQKCCDLLGDFSDHDQGEDGPLRHLYTDGDVVRYRRGLGPDMTLVYADGGMNHARDLDRYELLDFTEPDRLRPRAPRRARSS